jgi:hypothetical protein
MIPPIRHPGHDPGSIFLWAASKEIDGPRLKAGVTVMR